MTILRCVLLGLRSCSSGIAILTHPLKHSASSPSYPATCQLACRTMHLPSHYMNAIQSIALDASQPGFDFSSDYCNHQSLPSQVSVPTMGTTTSDNIGGKQASANIGGACKVSEITYNALGSNVGHKAGPAVGVWGQSHGSIYCYGMP